MYRPCLTLPAPAADGPAPNRLSTAYKCPAFRVGNPDFSDNLFDANWGSGEHTTFASVLRLTLHVSGRV